MRLTQFEMPMKAHFLSAVGFSSSIQPSSSRGWRAFRGIFGLSSASPTYEGIALREIFGNNNNYHLPHLG